MVRSLPERAGSVIRGLPGVLPAAALAGCLAAASTGCSGPVTTAHRRAPVSYYLSLGDSLSQGVQPDASGANVKTRHGYADQLYAALRSPHPALRLVKPASPGETTAPMSKGGISSYPGRSQLAAPASLLHAHLRQASLTTLDIGANCPDSCITRPSAAKLAICAGKSIPQATANLTTILMRLRQVDPGARIVAMNYYLPALAEWRHGIIGQAFARLSELAAVGYNALLTNVYRSFGVHVADVFGTFHTTDFAHQVTLPGLGRLPRNVAAICQWTWECTAPPRGPNQHANQTGYQVIAHTFLLAGAS